MGPSTDVAGLDGTRRLFNRVHIDSSSALFIIAQIQSTRKTKD